MIKYKKRTILQETDKPYFVSIDSTENHNEITIGKRYYALTLYNILPCGYRLEKQLIDKIHIAAKGFKNVNIIMTQDILLFTIKAKTERKNDDTQDAELAKKIVLSKIDLQAYKFASKIVSVIFYHFMDNNFETVEIFMKLARCTKRERAYFEKLKNK